MANNQERQERFRAIEKLHHDDLLWIIMKLEYGAGWSIDIDTAVVE